LPQKAIADAAMDNERSSRQSSGMANEWAPNSWRSRPIRQQPVYRSPEAVERALATVRALPPLVSEGEVLALRAGLASVSRGEAFLLQGGDCAERFIDCNARAIEAKLKILLQMSLVLTWGARMPIVRVGRMAGQYAKPRSKDVETIDGVELQSYRGDHVNGIDARPEEREPDPDRMVQAYFRSAATLNYARALVDGGFADIHRLHDWDLGFVRSPVKRAQYEDLFRRIEDALAFIQATGSGAPSLRRVDLYTSHEGLLLPYEEAQTVCIDGRWFNLGAHMLWIGDRTRQIDGAHVEYFRGIENPIGIKVGPTSTVSDLLALLRVIEPENRPGRVTIISRMGASKVASHLPAMVEAVRECGAKVVWTCDPMHGNTVQTDSGYKTRSFEDVLEEVRRTFDCLERSGAHLGGVHLELTGEDVTECTGGAQELSEADLSRNYATFCDPRLNYGQSLEVALLMAARLVSRRAIAP
jgi:3-deoxy-7-phosphoheptulonate synthase